MAQYPKNLLSNICKHSQPLKPLQDEKQRCNGTSDQPGTTTGPKGALIKDPWTNVTRFENPFKLF